ncbi:aTP-dependent Clp protease proteolytic subunit [Anaerotruncus sp. CAG:390]|nr:aTP-dependent Clp protease proteolytic subunit [Anaerotruncus sp. CAG:390]
MKKFWNWKNKTEMAERTLFLNGTIAEESWFDDDVTPQLFKDELMSGSGNITVWINSPGGDCVAAACHPAAFQGRAHVWQWQHHRVDQQSRW